MISSQLVTKAPLLPLSPAPPAFLDHINLTSTKSFQSLHIPSHVLVQACTDLFQKLLLLDDELEHVRIQLVSDRNFVASSAFAQHLDRNQAGCNASIVLEMLSETGFSGITEQEVE